MGGHLADHGLAGRGVVRLAVGHRLTPTDDVEERVDRALEKLKAGKAFTADEERWLGRIREHLAANLTIDREDFELIPVFTREGGWTQANKAFGGRLEGFLLELNEAMAA
ncbi:MAG: hypothetical protein J0H98_09980 [Solirubrobacterales bacterium]|nr:hypothetical protein [Solirubrobacterales bacterium]